MSATHTICDSKNDALNKQREYMEKFIDLLEFSTDRKMWGPPQIDKKKRSVTINVKTLLDWDSAWYSPTA